VGWKSGHADDLRRSLRLEDFAALGAIDGIAWFGLQKGREEQRRSCGALTLDPLGADIGGFADTATSLHAPYLTHSSAFSLNAKVL